MSRIEHQIMFISMLREFTGKVPAVYASQKEFFINSLRRMSEHLVDLKRETLKEICGNFAAKLDKGTVTGQAIIEFKEQLEKLVSDRDFALISGSLIGGKELIKKRLSVLAPLSLLDEEKKEEGRDPEVERQIKKAYERLDFPSLVREFGASPGDKTLDEVLAKARAEVAEYCCLYRIPLDQNDTFSPFSLLHVDAVLAACGRLLSNIVKSHGEKLVLIVDDDESILELLCLHVRKDGYKVEKAADGAEALQKAKALHPDLILLDLMLPKCSGLEVLRELQDNDTADIPIIIVTGRCSDRSTAEMLKRELNIRDLLEKPVKFHVLSSLMGTLLKGEGKEKR